MDKKVIGIPINLQTAGSSSGFKLGFHKISPFRICTRRSSSAMGMQTGLSFYSSLWRISYSKFSDNRSSLSFFDDDYADSEEDFVRKLKLTEMTFPEITLPYSSDVIDTTVPWWFEGHGNCRSDQRNNDFGYYYAEKEERKEGIRIRDSSYSSSSVNRAFSSMVFIIRELHSYTLHLRESYFFQDRDINDLVSDVHQDTNASFCWLFQQIFSTTPTLLVSLMLLLANFALHSMSTKPNAFNIVIPAVTQQDQNEDIAGTWSKVVEEAEIMKAATRHRALMNKDTLQKMVAPVTSSFDVKECIHHFRTELTYQTAITDDPDNSLLLCNYAQFLYLVAKDHDKADHYFRRAVQVTQVDVECLSLYANFLWRAKNDLSAAENTYLMAIDHDPNNSALAANYANFLWNTGGEDTCFLLDA